MQPSASQGHVQIFDRLFQHLVAGVVARLSELPPPRQSPTSAPADDLALVRETVLCHRDDFGHTLLHLAARNDKPAMYDHLVRLGATDKVPNSDGLTAFTMAARLGVWGMFNHIWDRHLTKTVWKFGNVERKEIDQSTFDWKGWRSFTTRRELDACMEVLLKQYEHSLSAELSQDEDHLSYKLPEESKALVAELSNVQGSLARAVQAVDARLSKWRREVRRKELTGLVRKFLNGARESYSNAEDRIRPNAKGVQGQMQNAEVPILSWDVEDEGEPDPDTEAMTAIRLITLFRPRHWYSNTKGKIEQVILKKWADGYYIVHLGQSVIPYLVVVLLYGLMWQQRRLNILQHSFWWAEPAAVAEMRSKDPRHDFLVNPVLANLSQLQGVPDWVGSNATNTFVLGLLQGPDSACGWQAMYGSSSGRLQVVLIAYSLPSLLRLAYVQRRIRVSDLDENEDLKISFEEIINFVYFNLESLVHVILSILFLTIGWARVSAGVECESTALEAEKNATTAAALFIFLNLFIVLKPYKSMGLLVLTIYKFLVTDVFIFLLMYGMFFAAFLLAMQTLHKSHAVYLEWMDHTDQIIPQVYAATGDVDNSRNSNPQDIIRMESISTALDNCRDARASFSDTALTLLQISFGDGFSNALQQARGMSSECAGYAPDALLPVIIILWVFLTNTLIMNMLVAMMNYTFDQEKRNVHSVWLLDVSYRIIRFEELFPELIGRIGSREQNHSLWSKYWQAAFWDLVLALYCLPEVHLQGFLHFALVRVKETIRGTSHVASKPVHKEVIASIGNLIHATVVESFSGSPFCCCPQHAEQVIRQITLQRASYKICALVRNNCVISQVEQWTKQLAARRKLNQELATEKHPILEELQAKAKCERAELRYLYLLSLINHLEIFTDSIHLSSAVQSVGTAS